MRRRFPTQIDQQKATKKLRISKRSIVGIRLWWITTEKWRRKGQENYKDQRKIKAKKQNFKKFWEWILMRDAIEGERNNQMKIAKFQIVLCGSYQLPESDQSIKFQTTSTTTFSLNLRHSNKKWNTTLHIHIWIQHLVGQKNLGNSRETRGDKTCNYNTFSWCYTSRGLLKLQVLYTLRTMAITLVLLYYLLLL